MTKFEKEKVIQVLELFTTIKFDESNVDDWLYSENIDLQEIISDFLKPEFQWCTAIQIIESAINIVSDAKQNGNI